MKRYPLMKFEEGEDIIKEGESASALYILEKGSVEVLRGDARLNVLSDKATIFGEMAFLLDQAHTATVRAIEPTSVYKISSLAALTENNPKALQKVAQILATRLEEMNELFVDIKQALDDMTDIMAEQEYSEEQKRLMKLRHAMRVYSEYLSPGS